MLFPAYSAPKTGVDGDEKGRVDESMNVPNAAKGSRGGVDEQTTAPNVRRGSTGGVDEQSTNVPNAARGSTGGVDEQSMGVPNAARGSAGGVDEQSMEEAIGRTEIVAFQGPVLGPQSHSKTGPGQVGLHSLAWLSC